MNYLLKKEPGEKVSSVKVSPKMVPIINVIGSKFKQKFNKTITITSGTRTAKEQAVAMHKNFISEKGTDIQKPRYSEQELFDEVAAAFHLNKDKGKTKCVREMEKVMKNQILKGKFVSPHLVESAVDIRTRGFQKKEIDYIIKLIKAKSSTLSYQDKRNYKVPHIHLQIRRGIVHLNDPIPKVNPK